MVGRRPREGSSRPRLLARFLNADARAALRDLGRFLLLTYRKAKADSITLVAAALAFVTVLALVPLMAAFSFIGARAFHQYNDQALEIFVRVLPYSESTIVDKLDQFLAQAETLQGFGLLALVIVTLLAFSTVEQTLNEIWHVPRRRPLKVRLLSFTLLLFWGPLLIGATFSGLLLLRRRPTFDALFEESLFLNALPFLVTLVGLTMLYWMVPYTTVRFRSALAGGLTAALLFELLRQGFALYIRTFQTINVVYGGFALALLFIISIELAWLIVLIGSEVAYTTQHFHEMGRTESQLAALQASWVGLVALALVAERFARGEPITTLEQLAAELHIPPGDLDVPLAPLVERGFLRHAAGDREGYMLAKDPARISLDEVLSLYEEQRREIHEPLPATLAGRLEQVRRRLVEGRRTGIGGLTLADLTAGGEEGQ